MCPAGWEWERDCYNTTYCYDTVRDTPPEVVLGSWAQAKKTKPVSSASVLVQQPTFIYSISRLCCILQIRSGGGRGGGGGELYDSDPLPVYACDIIKISEALSLKARSYLVKNKKNKSCVQYSFAVPMSCSVGYLVFIFANFCWHFLIFVGSLIHVRMRWVVQK